MFLRCIAIAFASTVIAAHSWGQAADFPARQPIRLIVGFAPGGGTDAIALTSAERSPLLPNVPTIAESGFPGYDMDTWIGMFVPRATSDAVVKTLFDATMEALKSPAVRERVESQAGRVAGGTPEQLDRLVSDDIKRYRKIVQERGIKAE